METKIEINCIIGIDPGANGGIAIWIEGAKTKVAKMPKDSTDLCEFFAYYRENYKPIVFLEKLSIRPDDVRVEGQSANMGKLYRIQKMIANYEHLRALIETAGIPYVLVHPMTWQTKLMLRARGVKEDKKVRKLRYQAMAAQWYPEVKVTLWNADALCIAQFGRWALYSDRKWIQGNLPAREYDKLF